jgi:glycosyltransferase involved in cell wall biosynthesis
VTLRVLFIEPFYGGSHRAFADGLRDHSRHEIVLLMLPEAEWRRRMRRGAQELAPAALALDGHFDAIVATDMLDLTTFLALTRRRFAHTPVLFYLHENQFTYPRIRGTKLNSWFGAMNYLSAAAADRVAFNSDYHRTDFLTALRTLDAGPNNWLLPSQVDLIEAQSSVLPIGVELGWLDELHPERSEPKHEERDPLVVWNARWEFDKAPDVFARALIRLHAEGVAFDVAIAGDPGPNPHPAMHELRVALGERVLQYGLLPTRSDYGRLLWRSDVVVSTARHEFFGVGMVEALYAGCFPVAPAAHNYPALVPSGLHTSCLWRDEDELAELLRAALRGNRPGGEELRASAARFAWDVVAPRWDRALEALAAREQ